MRSLIRAGTAGVTGRQRARTTTRPPLAGGILAGHDDGMSQASAQVPSYESGVSDLPLLGETIGQNLRRTVATYGDPEAMVEMASGRRWTYAEFAAEVDVFARGLVARGIAQGDRVGIWAPNCAEWTITQYATASIGAILVNINPAYRTHELAFALNQSRVRLLISATEFKTSNYREMIDQVRGDCAALEAVAYIGTPDWDAIAEAATTVSDGQVEKRAAELSFDDPINIQYTSGTTGFPKGATLSHHNILNNGYFVTETIGRRISWLRRSWGLLDQICRQISFGKPVNASTSARAVSRWSTTAGSLSARVSRTRSNWACTAWASGWS
jgi:fatty-acyl-CoA synthase